MVHSNGLKVILLPKSVVCMYIMFSSSSEATCFNNIPIALSVVCTSQSSGVCCIFGLDMREILPARCGRQRDSLHQWNEA